MNLLVPKRSFRLVSTITTRHNANAICCFLLDWQIIIHLLCFVTVVQLQSKCFHVLFFDYHYSISAFSCVY